MKSASHIETATEEIGLSVAKAVRSRRQELKLSQAKLASEIGISHQQMQKLETGENRISAGRLAIISKVLNVDVCYFYKLSGGLIKPIPELDHEIDRLRKSIVAQVSKVNNGVTLKAIQQALAVVIKHQP